MSDAKFDEVNVKNSPPQVNDSLWTPTWLTGSFLAKHLQKYYQNNAINVTKFDIKPAAAGDNYWSIIYRVQVHFIDCSMVSFNIFTFEISFIDCILLYFIQKTIIQLLETTFQNECKLKFNRLVILLRSFSEYSQTKHNEFDCKNYDSERNTALFECCCRHFQKRDRILQSNRAANECSSKTTWNCAYFPRSVRRLWIE